MSFIPGQPKPAQFSPLETLVLQLLGEGKKPRHICIELGQSRKAVDNAKARLKAKLGLLTAVGLRAYARETQRTPPSPLG